MNSSSLASPPAFDSSPWSLKQQAAWAWPSRITPSEWADANRILPGHVTSEPGPWRTARVPYLRGIMDAVVEDGVEEIIVLKAAQVGFSEAIRNILGFWVDRDPGPCLLVMPDQKSAEDLVDERIKPLIEHTPAVNRHLTSRAWDVKKQAIRLSTMSIYVGWSGSTQALASRPIRYLLLDEVDNYAPITGKGGDPISKAKKRITTYAAKGRARVILGGTPTTRTGNCYAAWESCVDQRQYWVPCPHCGEYQILFWKNVKYGPRDETKNESRKQHASRILDEGSAWYECEHCQEKIVETHKPAMLAAGDWASNDQVVHNAGTIAAPIPRVVGLVRKSRRIAFKLPAMYSPWVSFAQLASEWIEAQDSQESLCDFINQRLAEAFEEQRAKTEPSIILDKAKGASPPMLVPGWAHWLLATADTQGNNEKDGYFWYVIRAWGFNYRSQLVDYGIANTKADLIDRCLARAIPMEGRGPVCPQKLFPDSGGPRWSEIYQLAQADSRIHPTRGMSTRRMWMVEEKPQKKHNVVLWEIDPEQSKDLLHRLIHDPDRTRWMPHNQTDDRYASQMCAESKIYDPRAKRELWVEIVKNNNHIFDCEAIQCAAAWRLGAGLPEPAPPPAKSGTPKVERENDYLPDRSNWLNR